MNMMLHNIGKADGPLPSLNLRPLSTHESSQNSQLDCSSTVQSRVQTSATRSQTDLRFYQHVQTVTTIVEEQGQITIENIQHGPTYSYVKGPNYAENVSPQVLNRKVQKPVNSLKHATYHASNNWMTGRKRSSPVEQQLYSSGNQTNFLYATKRQCINGRQGTPTSNLYEQNDGNIYLTSENDILLHGTVQSPSANLLVVGSSPYLHSQERKEPSHQNVGKCLPCSIPSPMIASLGQCRKFPASHLPLNHTNNQHSASHSDINPNVFDVESSVRNSCNRLPNIAPRREYFILQPSVIVKQQKKQNLVVTPHKHVSVYRYVMPTDKGVGDANATHSKAHATVNVRQYLLGQNGQIRYLSSGAPSSSDTVFKSPEVPKEKPRVRHIIIPGPWQSSDKCIDHTSTNRRPVITQEQWEFINSPQVPSSYESEEKENEFWVPDPDVWRQEQEHRGSFLLQKASSPVEIDCDGETVATEHSNVTVSKQRESHDKEDECALSFNGNLPSNTVIGGVGKGLTALPIKEPEQSNATSSFATGEIGSIGDGPTPTVLKVFSNQGLNDAGSAIISSVEVPSKVSTSAKSQENSHESKKCCNYNCREKFLNRVKKSKHVLSNDAYSEAFAKTKLPNVHTPSSDNSNPVLGDHIYRSTPLISLSDCSQSWDRHAKYRGKNYSILKTLVSSPSDLSDELNTLVPKKVQLGDDACAEPVYKESLMKNVEGGYTTESTQPNHQNGSDETPHSRTDSGNREGDSTATSSIDTGESSLSIGVKQLFKMSFESGVGVPSLPSRASSKREVDSGIGITIQSPIEDRPLSSSSSRFPEEIEKETHDSNNTKDSPFSMSEANNENAYRLRQNFCNRENASGSDDEDGEVNVKLSSKPPKKRRRNSSSKSNSDYKIDAPSKESSRWECSTNPSMGNVGTVPKLILRKERKSGDNPGNSCTDDVRNCCQARMGNWTTKAFSTGTFTVAPCETAKEYVATPSEDERNRNTHSAMESPITLGVLTDATSCDSNGSLNSGEEKPKLMLSPEIGNTYADAGAYEIECKEVEEADADSLPSLYGGPMCYSEEDLARQIQNRRSTKLSEETENHKSTVNEQQTDPVYRVKGEYQSTNGKKVRWYTRDDIRLKQCYVKVMKINVKKKTVKPRRCR